MNSPASPYSWLLWLGIAVTLWWWSRLARRDERLLLIYLAALVGAFVARRYATARSSATAVAP